MSKAIMVDVETLASVTSAAITQIAAVVFDLDTGELGSDFDIFVKSGSGTVSRSTALWWMQQPSAAEFAAKVEARGIDLRDALLTFAGFVAAQGKGVPMFAHGAPFDFPVLRSAYEACNQSAPWSYRQELCTRAFYREVGAVPEVAKPAGFVAHDALSDCKLQVAQLVEARRQLGLVKSA